MGLKGSKEIEFGVDFDEYSQTGDDKTKIESYCYEIGIITL